MLNLQTLMVASTALSLFSSASAAVLKRNGEPPAPSCTDFTPFVYAGCYSDPSSPSALLYDSGLNQQNMTVETCVAFCKGNKYKYAGLEYYGECRCGASVNGVKIDESNCNFPCTGNKLETCGGNNIISIYQDPTFPSVTPSVISDYKPLGCYSEGTNGRSLAWPQDQVSATSITVESCLLACKTGGYSFAGVEFGSQCYCGEVLGNGTLPISSSLCNMPCAGNSAETCGGRSTLNLYVALDLESTEPCGYTPPVTTSKPTTSTKPTTTAPPPTTTPTQPPPPPTTSLCSSVVTLPPPKPTCEYKCGSFCSSPIPQWTDQTSCLKAIVSCKVQLTSCFLTAGFPDALNCFEYSSWCDSLKSYCTNSCSGWGSKCSKSDCYGRNPPQGGWNPPPPPPMSTVTFPCSAKPTTPPPTQTTSVPVPTATNICTQPNNPGNGYTNTSPVGNIPLPCLTCNNDLQDFQLGNCFKLYTLSNSKQCPSFGRGGGGPVNGCKAACDAQYNSCVNVYAQGCKSNGGGNNHGWWRRTFFGGGTWGGGNNGGDSYNSAMQKCQQQKQDCYNTNQWVNPGNRCNAWNQGWW